MTRKKSDEITFGESWISIEEIIKIASTKNPVKLNSGASYQAKIKRGVEFLENLLAEKGVIYGVTTGYGDSCTIDVPFNLIDELSLHLTRFHGCGLGNNFTHEQVRAIMAVRLCTLAQGYSGVSLTLLDQIITLLNHDVSPVIPEEGSVGASGDLTPLSYLAAVLIGERKVTYQGKEQKTETVFKKLNIKPITLKPKEALALMNGTAVMTALACGAFSRTEYLCRLAARLTAMTSIALKGNAYHFDKNLFAVKPHPGQMQIAAWIRSDLRAKKMLKNEDRIQDRYSLRCAPHVIGVTQDSLGWFRQLIENELNSTNDNPVIDGEKKLILHGGHFYGGHIATVMDTMKTQVANLADLADRQMAQLMDTKFNKGLPPNLSASSEKRASINHGFKAVQIGVSSWTAEALKNTMPVSVFSRSTECHNQDKVSMGTIAARDCLRVLTLTEQVFAAHLLATTQAIQLRIQQNEVESTHLSQPILNMMDDILKEFDMVIEDRPLEMDLRKFLNKIQQQSWALYEK